MKKILFPILLSFSLITCNNLSEVMKKTITEPEVSYKSFSVGKVSSDGIELIPVFEVLNKNQFSIPLDTVSYELSFNEFTMLDGTINNIGMLPANSSKDIPMSFLLNNEVLAAFKELLMNNEKLDYQIKGEAKVMGFSLPFEKKSTFYLPKISLGKVDIGNASFQELQAKIVVIIDNPNEFALPLDKFNYRVASKGKSLFNGEITTPEIKQGLNEIEIPLTIQPSELFSSAFSLLKNPNLPLTLQIDGALTSVNKSINLDLSKILSL